MIEPKLARLFQPIGVAVLGVSARVDSLGRRVFENLRSAGYQGALYAVNPKQPQLSEGERAYPSMAALPSRVDLVVIAVPAPRVPEALAECGVHGALFAIVLSAGFSEIGAQGGALLQNALERAHQHGVRVIGPNCLGVMRACSALNASFSTGIAVAGKLALVSQSGAVCSAVVDWAEARRIGLSTVVSLGAAADVRIGEVLDYLALDEQTDAILLYVEGVDDMRSFMSGLRAAARTKPVVVVKGGKRDAGGRAAASHTGAIVGNDAVFDAAVRRAGAVRVAELHELFSAAEALSHAPALSGEGLALITNAGGLGVLAVDRMEDLGIELATLSVQTRVALAAVLPSHAACSNPIDMIGDATPERYAHTLDACLADSGVHGILVLLTPQAMTQPEAVARVVAERERSAKIPIFACFMGGEQVRTAREVLVAHEVPSFDWPEAAVEAFDTLTRFARNRRLAAELPSPYVDSTVNDIATARRIVHVALDAGRSLLSQLESKQLLAAFGIAVASAQAARNVEQALAVAEQLGFPVALKIDSPDITHKTEVRGVALGIEDAEQLRTAYATLVRNVHEAAPRARIEGVLIERMIARADSRELLIGIARDPALGPAIAFGAGGTLVELMQDVAVELPPLSPLLVRSLIARTRVSRLLGDFRNLRAVDLAAVETILLRISDLACELPEVQELDINPLIVDPAGAIALDARIVVARSDAAPYAHLAIAPDEP